ncbi:hypothetical protein IKF76_01310 [Candidatus Saccharibacteria bacterium]|nr:hypothetical protein [Candidatus Saccharibacteria bacterium]
MKEVGMDASQSNENELQKAIDDITSGATAPQAAAGDVAADLEAKIQSQMGTPPVPPMPDMPASSVDAMNPVMPPAEPSSEPPAIVGSGAAVAINDAPSEVQDVPVTMGNASAEPEAAMVEAAEIKEVPGDLGAVRQAMLRDLFPLMDKVELAPEQKYDVYKEMIETTGDKNMIPAAYEAVKGIADDAVKAEALLYLVDKAE